MKLGRHLRWCLLSALLLAACSVVDGPRPVSQQRDGAPIRQISGDLLADAVPRHEVITASGNTSPYVVFGKRYELMTNYLGYREQGVASWYGTKFHGRLTSNGEVYDLYKMTAAHKTLPIPVYVRVTNLENNRSVIVRVNDRGPFHGDRLIDLSYAAAVKLGYADKGTARVEIEVIEPDNNQEKGSGRVAASP
ncbi:MAG: rare lipoprotein A, partial [Bermanella sp.]